MAWLLLILGVALWWAAHFFKRVMPLQRAVLEARVGEGAKGVVALVLLLAIILMVLGYRWSEFVIVFEPPAWTRHLNNLMMLIAVILFGMGSSKGRMRSWLRHPMLTGFLVWAVAHVLVNGDLASVILFGGLGLWAPVQIWVVNTARPEWSRPAAGALAGDVRLLVISVVVFGVIGTIHGWLGPWPFPG